MHHETIKKRANEPDEVRTIEKAHIELIRLGDRALMRAVMEPGWRWSQHVKPLAGTDSCQVGHLNYAISGRLHVRTDAGDEFILEPGDYAYIAPGHDAWVEGHEPFIGLDILGGEAYLEGMKEQRKAA